MDAMPVGDTVEPYNPDVHKSMWYNPDVHTEIWQNDMPFVLVKYNRRMKICRGCTAKFLLYHTKFVIRHEERMRLGKKMKLRNAYYHCNLTCMRSRHPYFKPTDVATPPNVHDNLTDEDIQFLERSCAYCHIYCI